jgi:NAD+ kinase
MTVGLLTNPARDPGLTYTREAVEFLKARGHDPVTAAPDGPAHPFDLLIALGGDGTMIGAARYAARWGLHDKPLLGINLGCVGYLTDTGRENGLAAIEKVLAGEYTVQKRMMLEAEPNRRISPVLNDVVVRGRRLTRFNVYVDGGFLTGIRADGIILATPTGSTAYSRSAGGPLLMPESGMIALTPICPIDPAARPWVLDGASVVRLTAEDKTEIVLDGLPACALPSGEAVTVRRAERHVSIIRTGTGGQPA